MFHVCAKLNEQNACSMSPGWAAAARCGAHFEFIYFLFSWAGTFLGHAR